MHDYFGTKVKGSTTQHNEYENHHGNELGFVNVMSENEIYLISSTE